MTPLGSRRMGPILAVWTLLATMLGFAPAGLLAADASPEKLVIESASGRHEFNVEIARTASERGVGLMYRRNLAPRAGMLFLYKRPQVITMWMKNTFIPLDMIFIDEEGRIGSIAERTVPHSLATISSESRAQAVLEVNAGTAARLGIRPGDWVRHPALRGAP